MSQEKWEYQGCAYIIILEWNSIPQLGPDMGISFGILMVVFFPRAAGKIEVTSL